MLKSAMGILASTVVLILLSVSGVSAQQEVHYVRSASSSLSSCPGQPCLTLGQYTEQMSKCFTTGSVFVFLAGNHTGIGTIYFTNVSGVTLKTNSPAAAYILCCKGFSIVCDNVTHLTVEGLTFIYSSISERPPKISVMEIINSSDVLISNSTFQGTEDLAQPLTRAVNCTHSTITITSCFFEGNTADHGGAIFVSLGSNVTLADNVFIRNSANISGGAIFAYQHACLSMMKNRFQSNSAIHNGGAIDCKDCLLNLTANNTFENNTAGITGGYGGGLHISRGNLTLSGIVLISCNRAGYGGGVSLTRSNTTHHGHSVVTFTGNEARVSGGAISVKYSNMNLGNEVASGLYFMNNSGVKEGGAIFSVSSNVTIMGISHFTNNYLNFEHHSQGGAIKIRKSNFTLFGYSIFSGNKAVNGGAMQLLTSNVYLKGIKLVFEDNLAVDGGAIYCENSVMIFRTDTVSFSSNTAKKNGGAIAIVSIDRSYMLMNVSGNFVHNIAGECGGGMYIWKADNVVFMNITISNNTGSGICIFYSKTSFLNGTSITNNTGSFGGGIHSENSIIAFSEATFAKNKANFGGSIYSVYGGVDISGDTLFTHNTALSDGGAIFALGTDITLNSTLTFTSNTAQNGGAICLESSATVSVTSLVHLSTSHNHAAEYGGVVYNEDNTMPSQCNFQTKHLHNRKELIQLPYCFFRFTELLSKRITVDSFHDLASKDGSFLYGGLFDRCRIHILNLDWSLTKLELRKYVNLQVGASPANMSSRIMASKPYQLCFCTSDEEYNCFKSISVKVYRGQKFTVPLLALDQMGNFTSTLVTAKTSPGMRVFENQRMQNVYRTCTNTEYQLYSMKDYEELILYPDGPCRDEGHARAVINVTFWSCPVGFMQSGGTCVCEERLQRYHANCMISMENSIMRSADSHLWIGTLYKNNSFQGLILYESCPRDYCRSGNVAISLQDPNSQCDHMRAGVLCGSCQTNHSLMLGSSHCGECPNSFHLALLLPFAAVGIALVVFLSVLRLTVATGMINSIILYANIVQINRNYYFPLGKSNILTVFVAWLNLDLGFETCFYDGMTAQVQTWLQCAFPLYVWVLISLIILTSRYSITVSKLIGRNPVAVLATLLLMSYTKILKVGIDVYSFAILDYPENKTIIVWRKDGNVPFFDPLQLLLIVVMSLVLIFFFLPYTLLILLGYKLYHFTDRKFMKWLNRLKPFLDSYYAPYRSHTRYWTGFLLLVRCALYVVFTFNNSTRSHTAVIVTFATIVSLSWISGTIYSKRYTNVLEVSTYLNLIVLSAFTLAGYNSAALAYSLVGAVFATLVSIIIFHFARLRIVAACLKFQRLHSTTAGTVITDSTPVSRMSSTTTRQVTRTEVCLREPLLEN